MGEGMTALVGFAVMLSVILTVVSLQGGGGSGLIPHEHLPDARHQSVDGCDVYIQSLSRTPPPGGSPRWARITVYVPSGARYDVSAWSRRLQYSGATAGSKWIVATGDAAFDAEVVVAGSRLDVFALLGARERGIVLAHVTRTDALGRVEDGMVTTEFHATSEEPEALARVVRESVATARALAAVDGRFLTRLRENAAHDPLPEFRMACLRELIEMRRGGDDDLDPAVDACLGDPDDAVRLVAARAHPYGRRVTREIAIDAGAPEAVRLAAIDDLTLEEGTAVQDPPDMLPRLLADPSLAVRHAAMRAAVGARVKQPAPWPRAVETLVAHAGVAPVEDHAELAEALGEARDPRTEPALIALLSSPSSEARERAVLALGDLGTAAALAPLEALEHARPAGLPTKAIRDALRAIRERCELRPKS